MSITKNYFTILLALFNSLVLLFSIVFTIVVMSNFANWALLLMWMFSLPLQIVAVVFSVIFLVKLIQSKTPEKRKDTLIKFMPLMASVYLVIFVVLVIVFCANNII